MTSRLPGLAVIGCGYWGSKHTRVIWEMPQARLAMAVDQSQERRDYLREKYGSVEVTGDAEAAFNSDDVNGVVIATPVSTHFELARQALLAGKHVLVEKPMVTRSSEAEELIALAEARQLVLMVGHTYEYHPAVTYLRNLIRSGSLGQIHYINSSRLNLGLFQPDTNVLWDLAPHDLSIIFSLLGQAPVSVSATGQCHILPQVEDVAYALVRLANGVTAHVHVSWLDPVKVRQVTVVGSTGMAVFNDVAAEQQVQIYDKRFTIAPAGDGYADFRSGYHYGDVVLPRIPSGEPLTLECEDFARSIVNGTRPVADGYSGLRVVQALEAATRSLHADGRAEPIALPEPVVLAAQGQLGLVENGHYAADK
ncbi:MAG TPA: Gfo/Idh/MocA family oxidoreductase [Thermomicrobiaceae bacterium]|nr:Gfo/Idh/MocA family oxidoreductase [Thermomicrobiaceae bacterium]